MDETYEFTIEAHGNTYHVSIVADFDVSTSPGERYEAWGATGTTDASTNVELEGYEIQDIWMDGTETILDPALVSTEILVAVDKYVDANREKWEEEIRSRQ